MNKYIVIDDAISKPYQDLLEQRILKNENFPWYYVASVTTETEKELETDSFGLAHLFYDYSRPNPETSTISNLLTPMVYEACAKAGYSPEEILYGRVFTTFPEKLEQKQNLFHTDVGFPHMVCLYYVNDSTGPTVFSSLTHNDCTRNEINALADVPILESVEPKKGRAVIFDGTMYHASTTPLAGRRCIINVGWK